jgi:hypothetical protein
VAETLGGHSVLLHRLKAARCRQRSLLMAMSLIGRPTQVCARQRCVRRGTSRHSDHLNRSATESAQQTTPIFCTTF